jgi:P27 family predicted phage terminase small subunit
MRGETRPSRTNPDEPQLPEPTSAAQRPPATLTGEGRREWQRLIATLIARGVLTDADLAGFQDYCLALSDLRRYELKAKRAGAESAIQKGLAGMVVKLRAQVSMLRGHLGLSPSSRTAVHAVRGRPSTKLEGFHKRQNAQRFFGGPDEFRAAKTGER